jgi:hypothetical protein
MIMEKKCKKCLIIKDIADFYKNKGAKDGHYNICKVCKLEKGKKWELKNREKRLLDKKNNYGETKDTRRIQQKKWLESNKERVSEYRRKYRVDNYDKIKKYRENNKEKFLQYYREYRKKYRKKYPHKYIWYDIIRKSLRGYLLNDGDKRKIDLGYTQKELKQRLECQFKDGMSWDNYGEWHVDHKKPITKFNVDTPVDVVNALCNLQPLWAKDNLSKGNRIYVEK